MAKNPILTQKHEESLLATHDQEIQEKGWSRYNVVYKGVDLSVLPLLGSAMVKSVEQAVLDDSDTIVRYGTALKKLVPNRTLWTRETSESLELYRTIRQAFEWLSEHPSYALKLKTRTGVTVLSIIGDAMIFLGHHCIIYPEYGQYSAKDGGMDRWKSDCIMFGENLRTHDVMEVSESLHWLSRWYGFLWT